MRSGNRVVHTSAGGREAQNHRQPCALGVHSTLEKPKETKMVSQDKKEPSTKAAGRGAGVAAELEKGSLHKPQN